MGAHHYCQVEPVMESLKSEHWRLLEQQFNHCGFGITYSLVIFKKYFTNLALHSCKMVLQLKTLDQNQRSRTIDFFCFVLFCFTHSSLSKRGTYITHYSTWLLAVQRFRLAIAE